VHQLPQAGSDEVEDAGELDFRNERARDLVERLELLQPAGGSFVQAGILDRDRRLGGQQLHELLILLGEVRAALLLGEVEVPVRDPAEQDRHAEERAHRGVVGWKADRARVVSEVVEPERPGVGDERSEDAAAVRRIADRRLRLLVDAGHDEPFEGTAARVDHAQRGVAGPGQLRSAFDDLLEDCVQGQLRGERDARVDDRSQPLHFGHVP